VHAINAAPSRLHKYVTPPSVSVKLNAAVVALVMWPGPLVIVGGVTAIPVTVQLYTDAGLRKLFGSRALTWKLCCPALIGE
jgi:hypothetical protein